MGRSEGMLEAAKLLDECVVELAKAVDKLVRLLCQHRGSSVSPVPQRFECTAPYTHDPSPTHKYTFPSAEGILPNPLPGTTQMPVASSMRRQ